MCLKTIKSRHHKPNDQCRVGYKVFYHKAVVTGKPRAFYGIHYHHGNGYRLGKSYRSTDGKIQGGIYTYPTYEYERGFHVFNTVKDAEQVCYRAPFEILVEVIAWDIRATGSEGNRNVFVAKNFRPMRIIKRV
jgi:hypothetical protein